MVLEFRHFPSPIAQRITICLSLLLPIDHLNNVAFLELGGIRGNLCFDSPYFTALYSGYGFNVFYALICFVFSSIS